MKTKIWGFVLAVMLVSLPGVGMGAVKENAVQQKYFELYPAQNKDPYTIYYPIELTRPGMITVSVKSTKLNPEPTNNKYEPLRAILVDSRAFKNVQPSQWQQWINKANEFNPLEYIAGDEIRRWVRGVKRLFGKKEKKPGYYHGQMACGRVRDGYTDIIQHAVDAPELQKSGGHYVLIFRNLSSFTANGVIYISYPGERSELDPEAERLLECHPDLAVTDVRLNNAKQLTVKVVNRAGCGGVPIGRWVKGGPDAITLIAKVNGRSYGVTLPAADPNGNLRRPKSSMEYVFDKVKITKSTDVTVTVDASNKLIETSETNNSKTVKLGPPQVTLIPTGPVSGTPDLTVSSIYLDQAGKVMVEVSNRGMGGVDAAMWNGSSQPYLNLKLNGNGWANITLAGLDKNRNLSRPGGKAVYATGYRLQQNATVTATIDASNKIHEGNENNNVTEVLLQP